MALKDLTNSFTIAATTTVEALPIVITRSVRVATQLLHLADEAVTYLAVEIDMLRLRQDAENAPVIAALKVIGIISTSMSDVDLSGMDYDAKVLHLEKCFELIGKINKLLSDMDKVTAAK